MRRAAALVCLGLATAGCGDNRPPAPSAAQNQQLDDAAAMLDNLAANDTAPSAERVPPAKGARPPEGAP